MSKLIKYITATPTRARKVRKALFLTADNSIKKHTPSDALAIFVEGDFSRKQWDILHSVNKNIYPCYSLIKKAKKDCYPDEQLIRVTETCAAVILQNLLNHTCIRLCKYLAPVLETCTDEEKINLQLITKWGCDGSQQLQYKQKFENNTDSDANIFQSSLVPLRLQTEINERKKIIWQNPVPSFTRFCRPIRIRFIHESKDVTNDEILYVENQARNLDKTTMQTASGMLSITHKLLPTMVHANVCNAATNTLSTMKCYICGLTSKNFNKLDRRIEINPGNLKFRLSLLHARIRFFESLLHLSYQLTIKKWQVRSTEEKRIVEEKKKEIQNAFREEMGLFVDIPKVRSGNTNDGNTSRRFVSDPEAAARITGIDYTLIYRFKVILETISSGHIIDAKKFETYAFDTATLYVQLYDSIQWVTLDATHCT